MNLYEIKETTIDYVLSLSEVERLTYYSTLIDKFYPTISKETHEFEQLLSAYETSFVVEKIYRNNKESQQKIILRNIKGFVPPNLLDVAQQHCCSLPH